MIKIVLTQVLDRHVMHVKCHHGWRDRVGHDLFVGSVEQGSPSLYDQLAALAHLADRMAESEAAGCLDRKAECGEAG